MSDETLRKIEEALAESGDAVVLPASVVRDLVREARRLQRLDAHLMRMFPGQTEEVA